METYSYENAILHVESLLKSNKDISQAVVRERQKRKGLRASFYGGMGMKDPTAASAANNVDEIPLITFMNDEGEVLTLSQPERWLNCFLKAWDIYMVVGGPVACASIRHRYFNLWSVKKIVEKDGVGKRMLMFRRKDFLNILLVLAAQSGLIKIK